MILDLFWRCRGKLAAPIGAGAALWYLMSHQWWIGEWQGGIQAATNALLFAMPLLTLAAAADARSFTRSSPLPWSSRPGTAAARLITLMFLSWAWSALVVVTVLATSLSVNAGKSAFHYPGTLPLLLPFAWTAAYTCLGYLLGRFLPFPFMVLGAVGLAYIAPLICAATPDVRAALFTFVDDGAVSPPIFSFSSHVGHTARTELACGFHVRAHGVHHDPTVWAVGSASDRHGHRVRLGGVPCADRPGAPQPSL
jgi:hypothetical protein